MSSRRTGIVRGELVIWDTDIARARVTRDAGRLTDRVTIHTVVASNATSRKTGAAVALTRDAIRAPCIGTSIEVYGRG